MILQLSPVGPCETLADVMSELSENSDLPSRPDSRPHTGRCAHDPQPPPASNPTHPEARRSAGDRATGTDAALDTSEFSDLKLHNRYAARLLSFVRQRIPSRLRSVLDGEEIVQETFMAYFRGIQSTELQACDSGDDWPLLAAICRRKLLEHLQWYGRHKRNTRGQVNLSSLESTDDGAFQVAHADHTASRQFRVAEIHNRTRQLMNPREIEINDARMAGLSDEQLQERFECTERTIRRAVARYRELLEQQLRTSLNESFREAE